jgi:hypothetical protein
LAGVVVDRAALTVSSVGDQHIANPVEPIGDGEILPGIVPNCHALYEA